MALEAMSLPMSAAAMAPLSSAWENDPLELRAADWRQEEPATGSSTTYAKAASSFAVNCRFFTAFAGTGYPISSSYGNML